MNSVATKKTSLILHGATGRMGMAIVALSQGHGAVTLRGVLELRQRGSGEITNRLGDLPVFDGTAALIGADDVVVDFSRREAIGPLVECLTGTGARVVCGTTGLGEKEWDLLEAYSKESAIFYDENMSYGVSVMKQMLRLAAPLLLEEMDVDIIEAHHRAKRDRPSGTAIALARAIDVETSHVGRRPRDAGTAGEAMPIHSIRAGAITGEHRVIFAGDEEMLVVSHRALSRDVFARGAIRAAQFISGQESGIFGMENLVRSGDA